MERRQFIQVVSGCGLLCAIPGLQTELYAGASCQLHSACIAGGVHLVRRRFKKRRFKSCSFDDMDFNKVLFKDCAFEDVSFSGCRFDTTLFLHCKFKNVTFENVSIVGGRIENTEMKNCVWDRVKISDCETTRFFLKNSQIDRSTFDGGKHDSLRWTKCRGENNRFTDATIESLHIRRCDALVNMRLEETHCEVLVVKECLNLDQLNIHRCRLTVCDIIRTDLNDLRLTSSIVKGPAHMSSCQFNSLSYQNSKITNMTMKRCTINEVLDLKRATFTGLKLKNMSYGNRLDLLTNKVKYIRSMSFKG